MEHRLPENERICSACGSEMVEIGKEVRRSLMMKPAEFWVREDVYYTYACKNCEQETGEANIVKAAKEPRCCPAALPLRRRWRIWQHRNSSCTRRCTVWSRSLTARA